MGLHVASLEARPLNARLRQTFAISSASQDAIRSVLVVLRLSDGTVGYGECAPMRPFTSTTQAEHLAAAGALAGWLTGQTATRTGRIVRGLKERLPGNAPLRAAVEMALLDALCRHWGIPMWHYFGGVTDRLETDYTISVGTLDQARRDAKAILRRGIRKIKIKIGRDPELDLGRILAIFRAAPGCEFTLDANQAYTAKQALRLLRALKSEGVPIALFEQPVPKEDWEGLEEISRAGGVLVCADESVSTPEEAVGMIRAGAVGAVNVKIMKSGLFDAREIAVLCRAAGLQLMIGGMVETRLAMTCAAHLASGLGGFRFVDLDTPFFLARDPMRGLGLKTNGVYDLSLIAAGIGVVPRKF